MVKLDVSCMRAMSKNDYRVLTAVEMGMKNHDVVPIELITSIAKLRHGGAHKIIGTLATFKLIAHDRSTYDGYRLTYQGYDILALRALLARGHVRAVGNKIGVGKESDVYAAETPDGEEVVLKLHRLGRTSFKAVKNKRDYLRHRSSAGWLYMSRLSALKEFAFMKALHDHGFPTPVPIDHSRHAVLMSLARGYPLYQIRRGELPDPAPIFAQAASIVTRLARHGLVHCDLNEFNLIVDTGGTTVTVIDFPQMVSTRHANAEELFCRDVDGILRFFRLKLGYAPAADMIPDFRKLTAAAAAAARSQGKEKEKAAAAARRREAATEDAEEGFEGELEEEEEDMPRRLDEAVKASGFGNEEERELERLMTSERAWNEAEGSGDGGPRSDSEDDSESESDFAEDEGDAASRDGGGGGGGAAGTGGGERDNAENCFGDAGEEAKAEGSSGAIVKLAAGTSVVLEDGIGSSGSDGGAVVNGDEDGASDTDGSGAAGEAEDAAAAARAAGADPGAAAVAAADDDGGIRERAARHRRRHQHGGTEGKGSRNVQKMRLRGKKLYRGTDF